MTSIRVIQKISNYTGNKGGDVYRRSRVRIRHRQASLVLCKSAHNLGSKEFPKNIRITTIGTIVKVLARCDARANITLHLNIIARRERMIALTNFITRAKKPLALLAMTGTTVGVLGLSAAPIAQAGTSSITVPLVQMTSLDPVTWGGQILIDQGTVFEGLYGYNQKNQLVPKIATKYTTSDGGRIWTFYLRKDAKWSNGDPVTANDFYYSWMRLASPQDQSGAVWAGVMNNVLNAWAYHAGAVPASDVGLKVINKYTLQLTLTQPHDILGELPLAGSMPLDQKATDAHPTNWWMPQYFVGDGPYVVKSFIPNGDVVLVRNPKYVGAPGETNVGNVQQINIIPAPTVELEDYLAGKLDVALLTQTSDFQYVKTHPALQSQLHKVPIAQMNFLQYDKSVDPSALDNPKVRQAIAMVINRAPIVNQVLSGMGGIANAFGGPGWPAAKLEHDLPYNVAKAQQLLASAGYPNGKGIGTLTLYTPTQTNNAPYVAVAEALVQEIKQSLGISFKIVPLASQQWGSITWGGMNQGIKPGYNMATGVANWNDVAYADLQSASDVGAPGTYGYTVKQRQVMYNWYTDQYNAADVKEFGNPNVASKGVSWNDWIPLQKAAQKDIQWLMSYIAKQPTEYRKILEPQPPYMEEWNNFVKSWKSAKTNADKHNAWVNAWKWVGTYSTGNGNTSVGLNEMVYWDQTQSKQVHDWRMWQAEITNELTQPKADQVAAKVVNGLMQQGYVVPLYYSEGIYLEKPNVTNVQVNPWAFGNFYQLQYASVK